jgi:hypothetical protein
LQIPDQLAESHTVPEIRYPIERAERPEFAHFRSKYYKTATPLVISGETAQWQALGKWRDMRFFLLQHAHRTVPIELGTHQNGDWREDKCTLGEFITRYIVPSIEASQPLPSPSTTTQQSIASDDSSNANNNDLNNNDLNNNDLNNNVGRTGTSTMQIAYLAQHGLVRQIPALKKDFRVPRYCGKRGALNINTWFGTCSTITPLHFDSYDNFLTQVAGFKYVRLYAPDQSDLLYVDDGSSATTLQQNISKVCASVMATGFCATTQRV